MAGIGHPFRGGWRAHVPPISTIRASAVISAIGTHACQNDIAQVTLASARRVRQVTWSLPDQERDHHRNQQAQQSVAITAEDSAAAQEGDDERGKRFPAAQIMLRLLADRGGGGAVLAGLGRAILRAGVAAAHDDHDRAQPAPASARRIGIDDMGMAAHGPGPDAWPRRSHHR
jgi:hypothetical protein